MADGRHLYNRKIAISHQRFEQSPRHLARWCILTLLTLSSVKFQVLKIKDGGGRHLEKSKNRHILATVATV